jgi:hypothetical protein
MATKTKDAELNTLAEEILGQVALRRAMGAPSYPASLRDLAELCRGNPSPDQVLKAAAKAAFGKRAFVAGKVDRKPTLDSLIYVKGDEPKKTAAPRPTKPGGAADIAEIAGRMLLVLEAQRRLGDDAYPPSLRRLAELSGLNASDARVSKASAHASLADRATVAGKVGPKPALDAPVALAGDFDPPTPAVRRAVLTYALTAAGTPAPGKAPVGSHAFSRDDLKAKLIPALRVSFSHTLDRSIADGDLPADVAWVGIKGKPYLFFRENIQPASKARATLAQVPTSADPGANGQDHRGDFASDFTAAFERLDRRNGSTNFVKLSDLRRELAGFGREAFDAGLRQLRLAGKVSLDSHEGLHGSLTAEDREAGVREAGSLLIYASRG